jgi:hypothetical protein
VFSQPHEDALMPGPPTDEMQHYKITTMHWCTSQTAKQFFQKKVFAYGLMMALLLATDEVHAQPVSVKHFCL